MSNLKHPSRWQTGQAGLVVLLLTVVTLTIGISVASRSTTDVKIARQEEESNRALNAAETGVEEALSLDLENLPSVYTDEIDVGGEIDVNYTVEKVNILEARLFEGVSGQVDVTGATNGRSIKIRWAKETNCNQSPAAILVTIYNDGGGSGATSRSFAYKCNGSAPGNNFSTAGGSGSGYLSNVDINLQNNDRIVRIKPIYNDTSVQVQGNGWNLPTQTFRVRSVAENQLGDEVRAVQVNRTIPVAPSIFDFVLFTEGGIVKQGN